MEFLNLIQETFILFLQTNLSFLTPIMQFFSFLGQEYFYILLLPAFFWCIDYSLGLRLGFMLMSTNFVNLVAKLGFHTPRPYWVNQKITALWSESSFSTPSGHAQNAASMWGLFSTATHKKWVSWVCYLTIFMIGFSRVFLGVHYVHDILLGWLIGILLVIFFSVLEQPLTNKFLKLNYSQRISLTIILSLATIFIPMILLILLGNMNIPTEWIENAARSHETAIHPLSKEGIFTVGGLIGGSLFGLITLLEKYDGLPDAAGTLQQKIIRYVLGIIIAALIYLGLKFILPDGETFIALIGRYMRYGLLGYWVAGGAPDMFIRFQLMSIKKLQIGSKIKVTD